MHPTPQGPSERLHARLGRLAEASGLPVPRLEIEYPGEERSTPRVRGARSEQRILAPAWLLEASDPEQTWRLAACVGWWASPVPRRRRRQTIAVMTGLALIYAALVLAEMGGAISWAVRGPLIVLGPLVPVLVAACLRREHRALDAAGHDVLRAAGYDPASTALLAFGGQADPPLGRRLASTEPTPSARIAAAGGRRS